MTISQKQYNDLRKMADRVRHSCKEPYTVKVLFVPVRSGVPGMLSITARSSAVFARLVRMVKRVVPEAKLPLEHGHGWHYLDRTPYHHSDVSLYIV